jgi:hypothetical protein
MMSPPQTDTDVKMSSKAAKVMGMKAATRRSSTRDQGKTRGKIPSSRQRRRIIGRRWRKQGHATNRQTAVPDPYPIDDDLDMDDDESPTPTPRPEAPRRKSKRDSVQPETITAPPSADDPVFVDPMDFAPAPVEAERPRRRERERERERERPRRERGNSDAMNTFAGVAGTAAAVSGFKNMFSLGRKKTAPEELPRERRRTAYETEDERRRRKRSETRGGMTEEEAKRLRHERRSVRKSTRVPDRDAEPMMTGANGSADPDPERDARRAERRARHEAEKTPRAKLAEVEAKAERRRGGDAERDTLAEKKARQMAELERRNQLAEEELRRMAEKDDRRKSRVERKPTDDGAREHRSSRRKDKEPREAARPNNERRRSQVDDDAERRRRHDERRAARRNSEYPATAPAVAEPIADYFDERNGNAQRSSKHRTSRRNPDEEANQPYINKGPDKTSSWIQSLSDEPPLPPPLAETVLDHVPGARDIPDDEETPSMDEDVRQRIRRGAKQRERANIDGEKERPRDREERGGKSHRKKADDAGAERKRDSRRKSYAGPAMGMGYEDQQTPLRTWDGRPALDGNGGAGKRGSWFKKIAGF